MKTIVVVAIWLYISGCLLVSTSPELTSYTDKDVLAWSSEVAKAWKERSGGSGALSYGSAVAAAGLGTGSMIAAATGSGAALGVTSALNMLLHLTGIAQPTGRAMAFLQGTMLVGQARAEYGKAITDAGIQNVPDSCLSRYGAELWAKVEDAINAVSGAEAALLPPDPIMSQLPQTRQPRSGKECGQ